MMNKYNINQTTLKILCLYNGDYDRRLHTREVARETGVDVKAVQQQLKRLEGNNIITSETTGRNKDHRLNTDNILTRYYLILAETYATTTYLAEHYKIRKILDEVDKEIRGMMLIFGSYAKGEEDEDSDIDILIINNNGDGVDLTEVEKIVGVEISAKNITREQFNRGIINGDPLVMEAISHHILLRGIDEFTQVRCRHHAKR